MYKLPKVHEKIEDRNAEMSLTEGMTVLDYFTTLINVVEEKLKINVAVDEKFHLDIRKWIWDGDNIPDQSSDSRPLTESHI